MKDSHLLYSLLVEQAVEIFQINTTEREKC